MRRVLNRLLLSALFLTAIAHAQQQCRPAFSAEVRATGANSQDQRQSILAFTPPALDQLARQAAISNSFSLDRTALQVMQALVPDPDNTLRPAIHKLDGISVRLYRFRGPGRVEPQILDQVRQAYDGLGWKHLVSHGTADALHKRTDLWLAMDGVEVRGGAVMLVTPASVSVITFTGNLNPVDIFHLRGHFGIPADSVPAAR